MKNFLGNITRKRTSSGEESKKYIRCLNTLDLSALGIASTIGIAVYILIGKLARDFAGPSLVISFVLAGASSMLSGLCYAEFGCRLPKAGSAYAYTYLALGEVWAFVSGWNMILEYIIGVSALSKACSEYINSLSGGVIFKFFIENLGWSNNPSIATFPDFLALLIVILISIIVGLGVKQSSIFNNTVTSLNIAVILFSLCVGSYFADTSNWSSWTKFAPFGFDGIITAAGSCFYAFAGFDIIGTAAEETINPKKAIPRAILLTISMSFLSYFGTCTVLTLMLPYNKLDRFAPLAEAFAQRGFVAAKYIIDVGAVASILTALLAQAFGTPRLIHAIAADGLLFKWLDNINSTTHVPVVALLCSSTLAGFLALALNLEQLIEMLSIGTLTAYTLVALAVLLTRYQCGVESVYDDLETSSEERVGEEEEENRGEGGNINKAITWVKNLLRKRKEEDTEKFRASYTKLTTSNSKIDETSPLKESETNLNDGPSEQSSVRASIATFTLSISLIFFCIMVSSAHNEIRLLEVWAIFLTLVSGASVMISIVFLCKQPMNSATFPFTVPFVPALPITLLFINFLLIVNLNHWTYVRFGVWMMIGLLIYGCYGFKHSKEGAAHDPDKMEEEND